MGPPVTKMERPRTCQARGSQRPMSGKAQRARLVYPRRGLFASVSVFP
jgi:hypothetical protein